MTFNYFISKRLAVLFIVQSVQVHHSSFEQNNSLVGFYNDNLFFGILYSLPPLIKHAILYDRCYVKYNCVQND